MLYEVITLLRIAKRNDQVIVKAFVIGRGRLQVTGQRQLVLVLAGNVEFLRSDLHALAHREIGPRLGNRRVLRCQVPGIQSEPRGKLAEERSRITSYNVCYTKLLRIVRIRKEFNGYSVTSNLISKVV